MLERFILNIQKQHLFSSDQEVLLAVSGGRDSVVLCELMHQAGFRFKIAHCNFHLRPGDCDRDEAFVRNLAKQYGVECYVVQFDTFAYASQYHLSIEEAARQLRYSYFEELRLKYHFDAIATGHHRDDSTETFFINLLRGTGIAGLHGIRPKQGYIIRPLLPFGRDEIDQFVADCNLHYVEDYTNATTDYKRNQIRHLLMPLMRKLSPSIDISMQHTISYLSDVEQVYMNRVEEIRTKIFKDKNGVIAISISDVDHLDPQATLLFELLRTYGFNIAQVQDIIKDLHSHIGAQFLTGTHCLLIDRESLLLYPLSYQNQEPMIKCDIISRDALISLKTPKTIALFDADKIKMPYRVRHWKSGDKFVPFGMKGAQLVSDYFSDHKFSMLQKQCAWLLVDAEDCILWIIGHRADGRYSISASTQRVLRVEVEE